MQNFPGRPWHFEEKKIQKPSQSLPYIVKILSVFGYEHKNAAQMAEVRSTNIH